MAMQSDGKRPCGPGDIASRPASPNPRPRERIRIRLRGNAFFTFFSISCPSGVWCRQRWVPLRAGSRWMSVTHPSSPERGGESRVCSRCSTEPTGDSEPILGGCWSTERVWGSTGGSSEHLTACRGLTCLPGPTVTSPASALLHVGCFSA